MCGDITRDACMLPGPPAQRGCDWRRHSFPAQAAETGEDKPFFIELPLCSPAPGEDGPVPGRRPALLPVLTAEYRLFEKQTAFFVRRERRDHAHHFYPARRAGLCQ